MPYYTTKFSILNQPFFTTGWTVLPSTEAKCRLSKASMLSSISHTVLATSITLSFTICFLGTVALYSCAKMFASRCRGTSQDHHERELPSSSQLARQLINRSYLEPCSAEISCSGSCSTEAYDTPSNYKLTRLDIDSYEHSRNHLAMIIWYPS